MDLSDTIHPNSEQVNAEDLIAGPATVTVTGVRKGSTEQPVFIELAEFPGRTYRPAKSMRRILVAAWGSDAAKYIGRRLTIFNDPTVKWAGQEVGGIRISSMSDIGETLTLALSVSRGKRAPFVVQPLDGPSITALIESLNAAKTLETLQAAWKTIVAAGRSKDADLIAVKDARKEALSEPTEPARDPAEPVEGEAI